MFGNSLHLTQHFFIPTPQKKKKKKIEKLEKKKEKGNQGGSAILVSLWGPRVETTTIFCFFFSVFGF
jgi:hypothetical protein